MSERYRVKTNYDAEFKGILNRFANVLNALAASDGNATIGALNELDRFVRDEVLEQVVEPGRPTVPNLRVVERLVPTPTTVMLRKLKNNLP